MVGDHKVIANIEHVTLNKKRANLSGYATENQFRDRSECASVSIVCEKHTCEKDENMETNVEKINVESRQSKFISYINYSYFKTF